jgi:hypothetical protein
MFLRARAQLITTVIMQFISAVEAVEVRFANFQLCMLQPHSNRNATDPGYF